MVTINHEIDHLPYTDIPITGTERANVQNLINNELNESYAQLRLSNNGGRESIPRSLSNELKKARINTAPRIMKTPEDYEEQKQVETERMAFSMERAEEIAGPLMSIPEPESDEKTIEQPNAKKPEPKPMPRKKAPAEKKPGKKKAGADGKKTGKLEDDDISRASLTTVGSDDVDTRTFALPTEIEGFEESVPSQPAKISPVRRFFRSLVP